MDLQNSFILPEKTGCTGEKVRQKEGGRTEAKQGGNVYTRLDQARVGAMSRLVSSLMLDYWGVRDIEASCPCWVRVSGKSLFKKPRV